jgi:hypothetical protein
MNSFGVDKVIGKILGIKGLGAGIRPVYGMTA